MARTTASGGRSWACRLWALGAAVWVASCGGDQAPLTGDTPAPVASSTPTLEPTVTPGGELDAVISAVVNEEVTGLLGLVRFASVTCAPDAWPNPHCPPGQASGSQVQALPFVSCDAFYANRMELQSLLDQLLKGRAPRLYAMARTRAPAAPAAFPTSPYALVFETAPPPGVSSPTGVLLVADDAGRVISVRTGCRATPAELYADLRLETVIVPPGNP